VCGIVRVTTWHYIIGKYRVNTLEQRIIKIIIRLGIDWVLPNSYHVSMTKKQASEDEPDKLRPRSIKVSQEDWQTWGEAAKSEGLPLSTWIKQVIRRELRRMKQREQ
jgi:hypothetical protein